MKQNNKRLIICFVIMISIFTAIGCVWYQNITGVKLTQLSPQGTRQMMGYIMQTYSNKMIVIDGGTKDDTQNLKKYIKQHNNTVDYWFITHLHDDHIGAFLEIAKDEEITIKNLVFSINSKDWYETYDPNRADASNEFFEVLDNIKTNKIETALNQEFYVDNLKVKILGVCNPEITTNAGNNSSMVIKFNVHQKSILFLGDTGIESGQKLIKNNKENLKSYIVQMAHHGQAGVEEEVYKEINPTICLWPTPEWLWNNDAGQGEDSGNFKTKQTRSWVQNLNINQSYIAKDGDVTINIW